MTEDAFTVNVFEAHKENNKYTKKCDEIIAASKAAETESEVIKALESVNVFFRWVGSLLRLPVKETHDRRLPQGIYGKHK